jgi:aryl-alcohol dehydrogenase-like predicted oxidoreductase
MKRIILPNTDLEVSQLSYGTAGYDGSFPVADGLKLFGQYIEAGGNFIDTAHCYCFWIPGGEGASERFVGQAVREFGRDKLVVATKGAHVGMNGYPRPDSFLTPEIISKDLDESLERLGLPSVDVYYLHRDDPRVPVGEIIDALNEHVTSGKVRYLGASNWSVDRYLAANDYAKAKDLQPFVILQNQWSLAKPNWSDLTSPGAVRYIEDSEVPRLVEHEIPVAAFTATAAGFFASGQNSGFASEESSQRLAACQALAAKRSVSSTQIALAFLMNQGSTVIPVIGTKNAAHLADSIDATSLELSTEEIQSLKK